MPAAAPGGLACRDAARCPGAPAPAQAW